MEAQQTQLDIIANNLANVAHERLQAQPRGVRGPAVPEPAPGRRGEHRPDAAATGPAGRPRRARRSRRRASSARATCSRRANPLDVAIQRRRLFPGADARRHDRLHARRLVPGERDRASSSPPAATRSSPAITIPATRASVTIGSDGTVTVALPGRRRRSRSASCSSPASSTPPASSPRASNLYTETAASGTPTVGAPGPNGLGTVPQGYVETSNVNVVEELVSMIQTQRAYEINSKAIQTSDQMLQKLAQL